MRAWLISVGGLTGFLVVSYLVIKYLFPVLAPFLLAIVLAQLVEPIVSRLEWRGKVPRSAAVGVVMLLITSGFVLLLVIGIAFLIYEIRMFAAYVPSYYALAMDLTNQLAERLGALNEVLPTSISKLMQDLLTNAQDMVSRQAPRLIETLGTFTGLPLLMLNVVIGLVATFFFSRDRRVIYDFLMQLAPSDLRPKIREVKFEVWASAMRFARAQLILIALTMTLSIIGLALIGSNYAVTIGLLVGFVDVLPVIGPAAVFLPWIGYHFLFGSSAFGMKILIVYLIVAGIRQVLEAKVIGEQIGIHPLATLFSLFLGIKVFGAWGVIAGPLLAILLKAMIKSGLLPIFREEPISR